MNPPRSAGDGRQEIQLTAMVPIQLPVLGNLACRLVVKILIRVAGVKGLSVPVPVDQRSAPAVVPKAVARRCVCITKTKKAESEEHEVFFLCCFWTQNFSLLFKFLEWEDPPMRRERPSNVPQLWQATNDDSPHYGPPFRRNPGERVLSKVIFSQANTSSSSSPCNEHLAPCSSEIDFDEPTSEPASSAAAELTEMQVWSRRLEEELRAFNDFDLKLQQEMGVLSARRRQDQEEAKRLLEQRRRLPTASTSKYHTQRTPIPSAQYTSSSTKSLSPQPLPLPLPPVAMLDAMELFLRPNTSKQHHAPEHFDVQHPVPVSKGLPNRWPRCSTEQSLTCLKEHSAISTAASAAIKASRAITAIAVSSLQNTPRREIVPEIVSTVGLTPRGSSIPRSVMTSSLVFSSDEELSRQPAGAAQVRTFASAKNPFVSIRADEIMTADQVVLHPQGATSSEQANSPADFTSRGGFVKTVSGETASTGVVNCFDAMRNGGDESDDEKNSDKTPDTGGTTPTRTSHGSLFCHAELLSHCKVTSAVLPTSRWPGQVAAGVDDMDTAMQIGTAGVAVGENQPAIQPSFISFTLMPSPANAKGPRPAVSDTPRVIYKGAAVEHAPCAPGAVPQRERVQRAVGPTGGRRTHGTQLPGCVRGKPYFELTPNRLSQKPSVTPNAQDAVVPSPVQLVSRPMKAPLQFVSNSRKPQDVAVGMPVIVAAKPIARRYSSSGVLENSARRADQTDTAQEDVLQGLAGTSRKDCHKERCRQPPSPLSRLEMLQRSHWQTPRPDPASAGKGGAAPDGRQDVPAALTDSREVLVRRVQRWDQAQGVRCNLQEVFVDAGHCSRHGQAVQKKSVKNRDLERKQSSAPRAKLRPHEMLMRHITSTYSKTDGPGLSCDAIENRLLGDDASGSVKGVSSSLTDGVSVPQDIHGSRARNGDPVSVDTLDVCVVNDLCGAVKADFDFGRFTHATDAGPTDVPSGWGFAVQSSVFVPLTCHQLFNDPLPPAHHVGPRGATRSGHAQCHKEDRSGNLYCHGAKEIWAKHERDVPAIIEGCASDLGVEPSSRSSGQRGSSGSLTTSNESYSVCSSQRSSSVAAVRLITEFAVTLICMSSMILVIFESY